MTRNRAILADIAEFNLDPSVAHNNTRANGRLARNSQEAVVEAPVAEQPVVTQPVEPEEVVETKNALVEVEETDQRNDPPVSEETKTAEEEKVEQPKNKKKK